MIKAGLTGNIGSGKSTVAGIFSLLKVPVYHADEESKKFLAHDAVIVEIVRTFGSDVLTPDHRIDRRKLAAKAFKDISSNRLLNAILHPLVMEDFEQWISTQANHPYVLQEAAILIESGYSKAFEYIIHISCPVETAIGRVMKRDQADRKQVLQRLQFQMEEPEKAKLADFIIVNDNTRLVIPQVLAIHRKLSEIGAQRNDEVPA